MRTPFLFKRRLKISVSFKSPSIRPAGTVGSGHGYWVFFKSTDTSWKSFSRANRSSRRQIWGVCFGGDGIPGRGEGRGSERGAQGGLRRKSRWVFQRVWDETLKPTRRKPALPLLLPLAGEILRLRTQLTIYDARQDGLNSPREEAWRAGKKVHLSRGFCNVL